jgi:plastocyanin
MDQPYCLQRARFYGSYGMETSQVSAAQDATNRCASPLHADLDLQPNFPKPLLPPMNKSTLHEMFRCETKIQIPRSIWLPALLRWALGLAVLIVPQAGRALEWHATVGAQSGDRGHQALAFLPNEIWIHAGDSITWRFDADDVHTVTFLTATQPRPDFTTLLPPFPNPATFDGSTFVTTPLLVKGTGKETTFTVIFPKAGNFKLVCLVHENMTGAIHVLDLSQPLPHDQDFYDRQAADQRQDLFSDRDGRGDHASHHSIDAHLVTVGVGEISANAGGSQTLSVVRFIDDQIHIRAGDTVEWNNHDPVTPHTVTFGTEPQDILGPPVGNNIKTDADGALHATISSLPADSVHSGLIVAPPQELIGQNFPLGVTRFRVTFTQAGTFPYICALHDNLGMKGMVIVLP